MTTEVYGIGEVAGLATTTEEETKTWVDGAAVDLTMGVTKGAVDDLMIGLAEGAVEDLATGALERTVEGIRAITGAAVEEATGEAVQKIRPV